MRTECRILNQDARSTLPIDRESIQLAVTSPPYFNLVDYQVDNQIGLGETYSEYVKALNAVWDNLIPYLRPDGFVCINMASALEVSRNNRNHYFSPRTDIERHFCGQDFYLHAEIIWDLGTPSYEQRVREYPECYPNGRQVFLHNFEYLLVFQRKEALVAINPEAVPQLRSAIWQIPWVYEGFPPPFAPKVVEEVIKAFSSEGDLIFDPFSGLGTVALEAVRLRRRFIGTELNPGTYARSLARIQPLST